MTPQPLPWCDPLALAQALAQDTMVLLHSSAQTSYSGRYSLLAVDLEETVDFSSLDVLDTIVSKGSEPFAHSWFGYLGYELKHDCERYAQAPERVAYPLPIARMMRFGTVYQFDHDNQTLVAWAEHAVAPQACQPHNLIYPPMVSSLISNMDKAAYLHKVGAIKEEIAQGNLYQANLTRKFTGAWENTPDSLALFARMCEVTPAPYSAYLRMNGVAVLSSSPELFLRLGSNEQVETRPIKGSSPRGETPEVDEKNRTALENSGKNRAENLMIVDLMRNDLSRSCEPGSVAISRLYDVNTHATIHHMASTISGKLKQNEKISRLIRHCFPPGSMTGAPKIRAVELCNALEGIERGIYSGAVGWLGSDGSMELSVVIRTLIMWENRFEFQVGGGIVADSEPMAEWKETMDKAMGIAKTLGITRASLESL